ncbi:hypothetical protein BDGGKGIB_00004 [Nodularia sphaerocarpa UHCC 0038]|nr:hypothetical protein BDGGKGIB_00004 [Nodularia sphaerocarpa UHCC 0038]
MSYLNLKHTTITKRQSRLVKPLYIFSLLIFLGVGLFLMASNNAVVNQQKILQLYPIPTITQKSNTYQVTVNGQPVFVNQYNSISYVHFAFAGTANIDISYKEPIKSYTISPKSINIPSHQNDNQISFSLHIPRKLIIHKINGISEELYILADPLEDQPPDINDVKVTNLLKYDVDKTGTNDVTEKIQQAINDVSTLQGLLYIPPGIYKTRQLNLKSNMIMYLAGGAILEGTKDINPSYGQGLLQLEKISNVKIMGRGVIHGNGSYWRPRGGWYSMIKLSNVNNVLIQDIIIRDSAVANVEIEYSENCNISNVKVLAAPQPKFINTDGFTFWSSREIVVDNVLYKGTDDATSIGGDQEKKIQNTENINVRNSIFFAGGGFKIGTTANQDFVKNITYENIDVVFTDTLVGLWAVTRANYENIYFKNIRMEDILNAPTNFGSAAIFALRIMVANWEPKSSPNNLGYIKNVYFQNLEIAEKGGDNSVFQGYDQQRNISNVNFNNFYLQDELITDIQSAGFDLMPSEKDGKIYVDLNWAKNQKPILNITSDKMYLTSSGDSGEFIIHRTGDTSQALNVEYQIQGTAENGKDYGTITNTVIIPADADSAKIMIVPVENSNKNLGMKTVLLSLKNLPNSIDYLLGPNFQAVVNILH